MRLNEIGGGVLLATGRAYASNAVAFVDGREALLVDGLGSEDDGLDLRSELARRGLTVRLVLVTHYFSDHMAALNVFREARIIAHRSFRQTFQSEDYRSEEEAGFWREPHVVVPGDFDLRFGPHQLHVLHVAGHTPGTLAVDVPALDLLLGSDAAVGRIVYLRYGDAGLIRRALERLSALTRHRLILGHGGLTTGDTLRAAATYLARLKREVAKRRRSKGSVREIPLVDCVADAVVPTEFEAVFHQRNLEVIERRGLFPVPARRGPGAAPGVSREAEV